MTKYRWGVRFLDGTYLNTLEGETIQEAVESIGSTMQEVRRYMPIASLTPKPKMSEETKEKLRQRARELNEIGYKGGVAATIRRIQKQKRKEQGK